MNRRSHLIAAVLAVPPTLAISLLLAAAVDLGVSAAVAGTVVIATVVLEAVLWLRFGRPLAAASAAVGAPPADLPRRLRELGERVEECEAENQRLAARLEDLSSSLGDGLLVVSSDLRVRMINRPALDFCGAEHAASGSHLLEILRDPAVIAVVEDAAAGGRPEAEVVESRQGLWEVRAFPVREGGAVVLLSEVSLVRRSAEFRRRFVQDLSHELRSPLAVLRTTVEALESDIDPKFGDVLVRQVERLDRLTRELFDLATIESGQLELELERVSVGSVVRDVVGDFGPEAAAAAIDLRVEVSDGVVAWCDRRGLYRILSNLVDNAIKYNRRGGWVEVQAGTEGDETTIRIADSGEGIPPGELRAVLQRFYRLDRARTPGRGGLGLGLAIVKHMVQHLGGRLDLRSREGVGTTVTVLLPTGPR